MAPVILDCASQSRRTATPIPETGAPSCVKEGGSSVRTALTILRGPEKEKRKQQNCSDQRDLTTSSALSNCVSTPAPSDSGEFSTTKSGSAPLPSIHSPCQVYQPATGIRSTYPLGNLKFAPPSTSPAVRVPTSTARRFCFAKLATISAALCVCS